MIENIKDFGMNASIFTVAGMLAFSGSSYSTIPNFKTPNYAMYELRDVEYEPIKYVEYKSREYEPSTPKLITGNSFESKNILIDVPKFIENEKDLLLAEAEKIFGEIRDFTEEEALLHEESIYNMFQPTGLNIFEL